MLAIDASYGIPSFAELRAKKPKLRLTTAHDDGVNMTGFAAHRMLEAEGVSAATIESWGGKMLLGEAPWDTIPLGTSGEADAVLFEAVMTPYWKELCTKRKMNFIPFDDDALTKVEREFAWRRATVPADRFPGQTAPFQALDFSDFLLFCRDDFPDDIAYVIAALLCETTDLLEVQYRHIPPKDSPGHLSAGAAQDRGDLDPARPRRRALLSRKRAAVTAIRSTELPAAPTLALPRMWRREAAKRCGRGIRTFSSNDDFAYTLRQILWRARYADRQRQRTSHPHWAGHQDGRADARILAAGVQIGRAESRRRAAAAHAARRGADRVARHSGRVGIMDHRCPHRRASLFFGRNEQGGLRCVYHGWKFDVTGKCLDSRTCRNSTGIPTRSGAKAYQGRGAQRHRLGLSGRARRGAAAARASRR